MNNIEKSSKASNVKISIKIAFAVIVLALICMTAITKCKSRGNV